MARKPNHSPAPSADALKALLDEVASGQVTPAAAAAKLRRDGFAFANLEHTRLDLHRLKRRNIPEAIYCASKSPRQIVDIVRRLDADKLPIICTRLLPDAAKIVCKAVRGLEYSPLASFAWKSARNAAPPADTGILLLCAGTSDLPVAEEARLTCEVLGHKVDHIADVGVAGIHRLLGAAGDAMTRARVIIVVAGMEGALPSVVAGLVPAPVIAVPTSVGYGVAHGGLTALYCMLTSCSGGIGVVNIDNGFGAALLAHLIVAQVQVTTAVTDDKASKSSKRGR